MTIPGTLPGVPYASPPRAAAPASALSLPPRLVVIHDTSNTASAQAEAHYAATRTDAQASWTSAHFYVDTSGPLGSLVLNKQAWAAYSYANSHAWQIEMCGTNAGTPTAVPAVTIAHTAALAARLCALAGIPVVHLGPADVAAGKSGICGHWDITQGLHVGTHDDPGPAFDWAGFINMVKTGGENDMAITDAQAYNAMNTPLCVAEMLPTVGVRNEDGTVHSVENKLTTTLNGIAENAAKAAAGIGAAGGLTDDDRALIKGLTDAVTALAHQLSTP